MPLFNDPDLRLTPARRGVRPETLVAADAADEDRHSVSRSARPSPALFHSSLLPTVRSAGRESQEPPLVETSNRDEFMQRIKNGEKAIWVPSRKLGELYQLERAREQHVDMTSQPDSELCSSTGGPSERPSPSRNLSHSRFDDEELKSSLSADSRVCEPPCVITQVHSQELSAGLEFGPSVKPNSPTRIRHSPPTARHSPRSISLHDFKPARQPPSSARFAVDSFDSRVQLTRTRAPSLQSSHFILRAPTTLLVHQSSNLELEQMTDKSSTSPDKSSRRHTLPPSTGSFPSYSGPGSAHAARYPASLQKESTSHWQSHQQRQSLTSNWSYQPASSQQLPEYLRRKTSVSENSALQRASMVGSYEESILRGRMSTTPSKPVNFTAKIGVLGSGGCKPQNPPHVAVDFPAVFYDYTHSKTIGEDPSPFVGTIDLEGNLASADLQSKRKRKRIGEEPDERSQTNDGVPGDSGDTKSPAQPGGDGAHHRKRRKNKETPSPDFGGCYRVPRQGRLQILVKNPNATVVHVFLVEYDLGEMQPGTKTFIRQRSLSSGAITIKALSSSQTVELPVAPVKSFPSSSKKSLRHLIHINICCPKKGYYYLYKNIRIVFANRTQDDDQKLYTEVELPNPRYSPWKPGHDSLEISHRQSLNQETFRRRSYGFGTSPMQGTFSSLSGFSFSPSHSVESTPNQTPHRIPLDDVPPMPALPSTSETPPVTNTSSSRPPEKASTVAPTAATPPTRNFSRPFHSASEPLQHLPMATGSLEPSPATTLLDQATSHDPDLQTRSNRPHSPPPLAPEQSALAEPVGSPSPAAERLARLMSSHRSISSSGPDGWAKLQRGEDGYGGRPGTPSPAEFGDGLLARRLKGLGMETRRGSTKSQ